MRATIQRGHLMWSFFGINPPASHPWASHPSGGARRTSRTYGSGHLLVIGGAAVLAGLICLFHPGAGVWAIVLGCALWFLLTGVGDLLVAAASPAHRGWFGILGVVSIVAAVVLLVHPGVAIVTVALVAGIAFLVRGAGEIALGSRMRSVTA